MTNEEIRDAPVPDWHIKTAVIYNENGEEARTMSVAPGLERQLERGVLSQGKTVKFLIEKVYRPGEKHLYDLCRAIHTPAESYEKIVKSNALFLGRKSNEEIQA